MADPVLLRLPFSHFCRKAEWGLTQAGVAYSTVDVGLFTLRDVRRVNPEGTVPVLRDGDRLVVGASNVLAWADARRVVGPALYPAPLRAEVRAWEAWADATIGPVARREAYRALIADPRLARGHGLPFWSRTPAARRIYLGVLKTLKARRFEAADSAAMPVIVAHIQAQLAGKPFLFGNEPTAADVATAAMLEPLVVSAPERGYARLPGWSDAVGLMGRVRPATTTRTASRKMRSLDWTRFITASKLTPIEAAPALRCECGVPDWTKA